MLTGEVIQAWHEALRAGEPVCMVTVAATQGSTPRKVGAKMLVYRDGRTCGTIGGGQVERDITAAALEALQARRAGLRTLQLNASSPAEPGMMCGGEMTFLLEPSGAVRHLHIFGAGHCGLALAQAAAPAGFLVHIYDDRPELVVRERFPMAASLHTGTFAELTRAFTPVPDAYVAIMTHAHAHDAEVLAALIEAPCVYIGLMASQRKRAQTWAALADQGISADALARVHCPIGLAIGAETPEEIAVSIVAELISVARRHEQSYLSA
ncbi:MAG: XdhC family protein [bacterium]|nr:XdhC family protein [bacterium]